ncbi:MAG: nitroreductase family protein [Syntrophotaleaceae bacterium]
MMQPLESLIKSRITCRNFSDHELSRETIDELITAATWVPSGSNKQPWHFVVISDREKLRAFSDAAKAAWLATLDDNPHMQQYQGLICDPEYNIFYNAPALVIVYGNRESYWHVYDVVAYNLHPAGRGARPGLLLDRLRQHPLRNGGEKRGAGCRTASTELVAPVILGHRRATQNRHPQPQATPGSLPSSWFCNPRWPLQEHRRPLGQFPRGTVNY